MAEGRGKRRATRRKSGGPQLLWGLHAVRAALGNSERSCRRLWLSEAGERALALPGPVPADLPCERVERGRLDRLLPPGGVHQGVVLEAEPLPEPHLDDLGRSAEVRGRTLIVALDQVTDPQNVGAVLRAAAAFGALAVIAPRRHAPEITGTLVKAASGGIEHVPYCRPGNLGEAIGRLRDSWGFTALGLSEEATEPLDLVAPPDRLLVVLGAEGTGLRARTRDLCHGLVGLPTPGPIKSLNVSTAAAIALYALSRP